MSASSPAGLVVSALVAALVAAGVALLASGTSRDASPAAPAARDPAEEVRALRREVASLREDLGRRAPSRGAAPAPGRPAAPGEAAAPGGTGPADGEPPAPVPATREELDRVIDERIAKAAANAAAGAPVPRKAMSLEDAGMEIGLTAQQIETARRVYRDSEEEFLQCVLGTSDLERIKEEVKGLRDDPDRYAAFVQRALANAFSNAGKLMTLESRRDRELRRVLDEEQVKKLKGYNVKPVTVDAELDKILKEAFGDE